MSGFAQIPAHYAVVAVAAAKHNLPGEPTVSNASANPVS
jgi:hypothetical protein